MDIPIQPWDDEVLLEQLFQGNKIVHIPDNPQFYSQIQIYSKRLEDSRNSKSAIVTSKNLAQMQKQSKQNMSHNYIKRNQQYLKKYSRRWSVLDPQIYSQSIITKSNYDLPKKPKISTKYISYLDTVPVKTCDQQRDSKIKKKKKLRRPFSYSTSNQSRSHSTINTQMTKSNILQDNNKKNQSIHTSHLQKVLKLKEKLRKNIVSKSQKKDQHIISATPKNKTFLKNNEQQIQNVVQKKIYNIPKANIYSSMLRWKLNSKKISQKNCKDPFASYDKFIAVKGGAIFA